jgi:predicted nucleotidyltransferase
MEACEKNTNYRQNQHSERLSVLVWEQWSKEVRRYSMLYNNHMATPVVDLSPDQLDQYRHTAVRRQKIRVAKIKPRMEKAWKLARKAAKVLREQYHAKRVAVFGSLLHESRFTEWSDVDIAAWGISSEQTFRAIGAVMDLDPLFGINLVDVNTCTPSLLRAIEEEGVDL